MLNDRDPTAPPLAEDRAVLDQVVEGTTALLLVGPQEQELHLTVDALPEGAAEGDCLILELPPGQDLPRVVGIDRELTQARRAAVTSRLTHVRERRSGGRFDR